MQTKFIILLDDAKIGEFNSQAKAIAHLKKLIKNAETTVNESVQTDIYNQTTTIRESISLNYTIKKVVEEDIAWFDKRLGKIVAELK